MRKKWRDEAWRDTHAVVTGMSCAGSVKDIKWHEVHVGMVLEVRDNENIPADLLCLHCTHADNVCFIKTVNLDGELLDYSTSSPA